MLFHGNLLKRYVNIKDEPENIGNYLTLKTAEVEEVHKRQIPQEVVIGYVTKCEKHPDADKLKVTQVDCGEKWIYQIVTGADNIKADIYVPVALPGAYLPAKDLKIKPVKMRWIDSNGMICSKEELGIAEDLDKHWIWILDEDLNTLSKEDLWKPLSYEVPFLNNFVFDIDNKTLTNRPDLTWHLWQAIELNAIYKTFEPEKVYLDNVKQIFETFFDSNIFDVLENSNKAQKEVKIQTPKCRSYLALELNNVKIKKSDFKQRLDLIDLGEDSINNWVDFSNIFMFLTSQPIHFFDAERVVGDIRIKEAEGGETFKALDGKEYKLEKWDIIIVDNEKILALAGVIWWESSAVNETTKNILVEIANFDPIQIRKTGNRLALRTNAKIRFEKNINPVFSLYALLLFLDQLKMSGLEYELWGVSYDYDEEIKKILFKNVDIDFDDLRSFSGLDISDEEIKWILEKLGFRVEEVRRGERGQKRTTWEEGSYQGSVYKVIVPVWRSPADINIPEDIYEEVIRVYGYENISGSELNREVEYVPYTEKVDIVRLVEQNAVEDYHFNLLETYPWFNSNKEKSEIAGLPVSDAYFDKLLSLKNPTAPENKYLRDTLFFNLLGVIEKNFRFFDKIKIIETWKIFRKGQKRNESSEENQNFSCEERLVAGAMMYQKDVKNWQNNNIFVLKNLIKKILKEYNLKGLLEIKPGLDNEDLQKLSHPKQAGTILLNKQPIGKIFTLHPYYHKNFKFPEKAQITYIEIDLDKLIDLKKKSKQKPIQKVQYYTLEDQIVERDLSFVIPKSDNYGKILQAVSKIKQIIDVETFDLYDLWDEKSISIRIKIYGENMTSEDINQVMEKAIKEAEKVGARLR